MTRPGYDEAAYERGRARAREALDRALERVENEIAARVARGEDTGDDGGHLVAGPGTHVPTHWSGRGRTNFLRWIADNLRSHRDAISN